MGPTIEKEKKKNALTHWD